MAADKSANGQDIGDTRPRNGLNGLNCLDGPNGPKTIFD